VRGFLVDPVVSSQLDTGQRTPHELVQLAGGAPGRLIGREAWQTALAQARRILDATTVTDRGARMRVALAQGASGARGKFSDMLDALTVLLHDRSRSAAESGNERDATGFARAVEAVERAKDFANGNVNPQLLTASLLREIGAFL
jgi:DNA polymerase-3 subunit delta'